jgi:hypothetical protein
VLRWVVRSSSCSSSGCSSCDSSSSSKTAVPQQSGGFCHLVAQIYTFNPKGAKLLLIENSEIANLFKITKNLYFELPSFKGM